MKCHALLQQLLWTLFSRLCVPKLCREQLGCLPGDVLHADKLPCLGCQRGHAPASVSDTAGHNVLEQAQVIAHIKGCAMGGVAPRYAHADGRNLALSHPHTCAALLPALHEGQLSVNAGHQACS